MALTTARVDTPPGASTRHKNKLAPGMALVIGATAVSIAVNRVVPSISALVVAVGLGAVLANTGGVTAATDAGLRFARQRLLRVGVVLLGLRLSLTQITELGVTTIAVIVATVTATFFGTQAIGRRLGLSPELSLLVATGYSICGASAIAAVQGSLADRDGSGGNPDANGHEEEVAVAVGLVTLCGTLAMLALPPVAAALGLSDHQFGTWVGASIHDVAQVVAAGSVGGPEVLAVAIVVKLTRVSLLAPVVAGVNISRHRRSTSGQSPERAAPKGPPIIPLFVAGFLAMVLVRTTGWLPPAALEQGRLLEGLALTAALVGLGSGVKVSALRTLGAAPLVLGALAWAIVAVVSLIGVLAIG